MPWINSETSKSATRQGPAFIKINARTINYRPADIEAFLAARLQPGASA
jgi:hypothetical protein